MPAFPSRSGEQFGWLAERLRERPRPGFGRKGAVWSGQQLSGPRRRAGNKIRWRRGGVELVTTQVPGIQALVPTILLRQVGPSWRTAPWRRRPRPTSPAKAPDTLWQAGRLTHFQLRKLLEIKQLRR